jgi:hypothetical protein
MKEDSRWVEVRFEAVDSFDRYERRASLEVRWIEVGESQDIAGLIRWRENIVVPCGSSLGGELLCCSLSDESIVIFYFRFVVWCVIGWE